jgi:Domain of unknown function (DUF4440)
MKKTMMILMIAIAATTSAFSQSKMSKNPKVEAQIIALEKAGWEAWKNKNAAWSQTNLTEDFLMVNSKGVTNKAQVIKSTLTDCNVKSFSLDNFKFVMLDENAALLTYTAMQDAVCSGETIPAQVRASVNYVKRGGKWLEALYMETPMSQ